MRKRNALHSLASKKRLMTAIACMQAFTAYLRKPQPVAKQILLAASKKEANAFAFATFLIPNLRAFAAS